MIFIKVDVSNTVWFTHYSPFDKKHGLGKTKGELELEGHFIESIPEAEFVGGKSPILKYDSINGTIFYEYVDRPMTQEEEFEQLKTQLSQTQDDLGTSLFESAMDKARIADLEAIQGEMLMEIAMIKMGGAL
ncbi:hypothetical protein MKZ26_03150 [Sporosarcina sp. FSL K6-6792]|uniref:hypothetical protein n=1 Tax=Sporosarcina sp. FSL K6-6792 TaxID=2921559 RepID=UPI0030F9D36E